MMECKTVKLLEDDKGKNLGDPGDRDDFKYSIKGKTHDRTDKMNLTKIKILALAGVAQWIEHWPAN